MQSLILLTHRGIRTNKISWITKYFLMKYHLSQGFYYTLEQSVFLCLLFAEKINFLLVVWMPRMSYILINIKGIQVIYFQAIKSLKSLKQDFTWQERWAEFCFHYLGMAGSWRYLLKMNSLFLIITRENMHKVVKKWSHVMISSRSLKFFY